MILADSYRCPRCSALLHHDRLDDCPFCLSCGYYRYHFYRTSQDCYSEFVYHQVPLTAVVRFIDLEFKQDIKILESMPSWPQKKEFIASLKAEAVLA